MLDQIRNFSRSWIFKLLFGLLIVSFMLSGVSGDIYQSMNDNYLVKVGKDKIYLSEVEKKYADTVHDLRSQGLDYTEEQFASLGISKQQIAQSMIQRSLIAQEVANLGLSVGDDIVAAEIRKIPFLQKDGKFDTEALRLTLYKQGIREKQFTENIRAELAADMLKKAILQKIPQINVIESKSIEALTQKRDVDYVQLPAGYDKVEAVPIEQEIKEFYDENGITFQVPEKRKFEYLVIPADANKAALYDKVAKLEDMLAAGGKFVEVAKKQNLKYAVADNINKEDDKFSDKFMDIAFAVEQGAQSGVIEDSDGTYFTINVLNISDARIPELQEIKDKIIAAWKVDKQQKRDVIFANEIYEKAKTSGDLQKVADEYGLPLQKISNLSRDEMNKFDFDFITAAFNTPAGKLMDGVFEDTKGGFKIALVAKINNNNPTEADKQKYAAQLVQSEENDIMGQYFEYLRGKYPVKQNPKANSLK